MANKLEKNQQKQIESLEEGLFAPIWKKIFSGRLKKQLKQFEKDPAMRDALKRFDQSLEEFERSLEVSSELVKNYSTDPDERLPKEHKDKIKFLKSIGKW